MCIKGSKWNVSIPVGATRCWGWDLYSTALLCLGLRLAHSTRSAYEVGMRLLPGSTLIDANGHNLGHSYILLDIMGLDLMGLDTV